MDLDQITDIVRHRLPQKRFLHSVGVVKEAQKLSALCGADPEKASIAAILHDITKPLPTEEQLKICKEAGVVLNLVEQHETKVLHAITGAIMAKKLCGIEEPEILSAIRYHTTGKANMSPLEKVIYLADFIEEGRTFEGVDMLREAVYQNVEDGLLKAFDFSILEVVQKGAMLHPDSIEGRNDLLARRK